MFLVFGPFRGLWFRVGGGSGVIWDVLGCVGVFQVFVWGGEESGGGGQSDGWPANLKHMSKKTCFRTFLS